MFLVNVPMLDHTNALPRLPCYFRKMDSKLSLLLCQGLLPAHTPSIKVLIKVHDVHGEVCGAIANPSYAKRFYSVFRSLTNVPRHDFLNILLLSVWFPSENGLDVSLLLYLAPHLGPPTPPFPLGGHVTYSCILCHIESMIMRECSVRVLSILRVTFP